MKWTKTKPTKPGWYWWRYSNRRACPVRVAMFRGKLWVDSDDAGAGWMSNWGGQWAGPIPEPQ